jgi:nucleotide-binding universal stress UspA family protein
MYRRILVPIDGSAPSLLGLKQAIGLAKDQRARLRILNVVDVLSIMSMLTEPAAAADLTNILDSLREEGRKALDKAAVLAAKSGVKAQTVQVESGAGAVSDAILADARRSRADVIVMGTHGRRGLNRLLLGSDAERVLREAPVPVLLTRGGAATRAVARRKTRRAA